MRRFFCGSFEPCSCARQVGALLQFSVLKSAQERVSKIKPGRPRLGAQSPCVQSLPPCVARRVCQVVHPCANAHPSSVPHCTPSSCGKLDRQTVKNVKQTPLLESQWGCSSRCRTKRNGVWKRRLVARLHGQKCKPSDATGVSTTPFSLGAKGTIPRCPHEYTQSKTAGFFGVDTQFFTHTCVCMRRQA